MTLRQEHSLRVFENRVLKKIFQLKCDELRRDGRKLHNQVLCDLYYSPKIILVVKSVMMRWRLHVASMVKGRGAYTVLVGKTKGMKTIRKPWRRRENNSKMDLKRICMELRIDCSV
jgi:hypothetical protein